MDMKLALVLIGVVLISFVYPSDAEEDGYDVHWSYKGEGAPVHWAEILPDKCGGDKLRQSPIDIRTEQLHYKDTLGVIDIQIFEPAEGEENSIMKIVNNGHSVNIDVNGEIQVTGGDLGSIFKVAGLHFHWGSTDEQGSEHLLDGKAYPLEMHIVTYDKEKYATIGEAVNGKDSLAVLGTFFEISEEDNPVLDLILNAFTDVMTPDENKVAMPWFDIVTLLPMHTEAYMRYYGSLTTPPCAESVIWTVFKETQKISAAQMMKFRELQDSHGAPLVDNYRPTQPIHDRMVCSSFVPKQIEHYEVLSTVGSGATAAIFNAWLVLAAVLFTALRF